MQEEHRHLGAYFVSQYVGEFGELFLEVIHTPSFRHFQLVLCVCVCVGWRGEGEEGRKRRVTMLYMHDFLLMLQVVPHSVELCSWVSPD